MNLKYFSFFFFDAENSQGHHSQPVTGIPVTVADYIIT